MLNLKTIVCCFRTKIRKLIKNYVCYGKNNPYQYVGYHYIEAAGIIHNII